MKIFYFKFTVDSIEKNKIKKEAEVMVEEIEVQRRMFVLPQSHKTRQPMSRLRRSKTGGISEN